MTTENFTIQYSFKTPAGTLVNVRGKDAFELKSNLETALDDAIVTLFGQAEQLYTAASNVASTPPASQQAAPQQQQYQAPPQQSGPPAPACAHGAMVPRSGEKNGKAWSAFFCPQPRGRNQCEPVWNR